MAPVSCATMTELELGPLRFGVVGAGRLGLTLARVLQAREFEVVHVSSRSAAGRERAVRLLGVPAHAEPLPVATAVDCVLIAVPDDALDAVVAAINRRAPDASPRRLRIVSTSAAGGLAALEPLARAGHDVCVLHPVASITEADPSGGALSGAGAAIGARDDAAQTFAHALAHALGMHPFDLFDDGWPLHAAACTAAANFTLAVLGLTEDLAAAAGVHDGVARAVYGRLAREAVERATRDGALAALAGPVPRGDAAAISKQVHAVATHAPAHELAFASLLSSTIRRAFEGGRIDFDTAARLQTTIHHGEHD